MPAEKLKNGFISEYCHKDLGPGKPISNSLTINQLTAAVTSLSIP